MSVASIVTNTYAPSAGGAPSLEVPPVQAHGIDLSGLNTHSVDHAVTSRVSHMLQQLQQLRNSSPVQYAGALSRMATSIQNAAATSHGNAAALATMAAQLSQAAASGDLSALTSSFGTGDSGVTASPTQEATAAARYAQASRGVAETAGGDITHVLSDVLDKFAESLSTSISTVAGDGSSATPSLNQQTAAGSSWMAASSAVSASPAAAVSGPFAAAGSGVAAVSSIVETTA